MSKQATASLERLRQIFSMPLDGNAALLKIEAEMSANLLEFLRHKIVAERIEPRQLENFFRDFRIPDAPLFVSEQAEFLLQTAVAPCGQHCCAKIYRTYDRPAAEFYVALEQNHDRPQPEYGQDGNF